VLLGENEGANPVEFLLHALAGCVTTTTVLQAASRGIEIESLSTTLVGNIDMQGLLALGDVPAGYQGIRIEMDIRQRTRATRISTICCSLRRRTRRYATPCVDPYR